MYIHTHTHIYIYIVNVDCFIFPHPIVHHVISNSQLEEARSCDVVFLAVDGRFSKEFARAISEGKDGATVIDNSSAFRMDPDVPLVIPEININVR